MAVNLHVWHVGIALGENGFIGVSACAMFSWGAGSGTAGGGGGSTFSGEAQTCSLALLTSLCD